MSEVVTDATLAAPMPGNINPDSQEYWEATAQGRLLIRRCNACHEPIWYPRPICPFCHSTDTTWEESSGRGTVYTFAIVHRGVGAYAKTVPYVLAYVQLDEGPRMITNIVDCDPSTVEIGQAVEVVFHKTEGDMALPRFRPVG